MIMSNLSITVNLDYGITFVVEQEAEQIIIYYI